MYRRKIQKFKYNFKSVLLKFETNKRVVFYCIKFILFLPRFFVSLLRLMLEDYRLSHEHILSTKLYKLNIKPGERHDKIETE